MSSTEKVEHSPDAEHDLDELLAAVAAIAVPMTEAGMKRAVTAAKLQERKRQRRIG